MDAERRLALTKSLTDRLEADTHGRDRIERVRWLFDHLEEYLQRWSGWCALACATASDVIENDLYAVLILAADVIDEEVALVRFPILQQKWREFAEGLRTIDGNSDKESVVVAITKGFGVVQKELLRCIKGGLDSAEENGAL